MHHNCFYDNTGISFSSQNIDASVDPLVDHVFYELDNSTPSGLGCINGGVSVAETLDFDRTLRVLGNGVDIGAQEAQ